MLGDALGGITGWVTLALFLALAALETVRPARKPGEDLVSRWIGNVTLCAVTGGCLLLPVLSTLTASSFAQSVRVGLFDWLGLPAAVRLVVTVLALDAVIYATHRILHALGPLWRLHAVHHSDPSLDAATTLRHHPAEALIMSLILGSAVFVLGISPGELATYLLLEGLVQLAAHANIALPPRLEAVLRTVLVTPGFHRLHHSRDVSQTDTNYGQVFTIWDRLFGTSCPEPAPGQDIVFGLDSFREAKLQQPHWLLVQPLMPRHPAARTVAADPAATRAQTGLRKVGVLYTGTGGQGLTD